MDDNAARSKNKRSLLTLGLSVSFLHILGWGLLFAALAMQPKVGPASTITIGTGALAYLLGLRHAFDADHVAAIDNTTRKLINDGKKPNSVGFWFALGHSTVVFILAGLLAFGVTIIGKQLANSTSPLHHIGAIIGGTVSGVFLILIAVMNSIVLFGIFQVLKKNKNGLHDEAALENHLNNRGFMNRFFKKFSKTIDKPGKMYPLGILFGLGFDTATEIALLAITGSAALAGGSPLAVIALPLIFAAGMTLGDTADGIFMNHAYNWAFVKPVRRLYYNITITSVSVIAAIVIAIPVLAGALIATFNLTGGIWTILGGINLGNAGFLLAGTFVATWLVAAFIWKFGKIEQRWALPVNEQHVHSDK